MTLVSLTVSAAVGLATIVFGILSAQRAQYERVLNVIDYISGPHVSPARHELGLMIHTEGYELAGTTEDLTRDLFAILWAFSRLNAVRRTLPAQNIFRRVWLTGPHDMLRRTTQPFVNYWWTPLETARDRLGADIAGSDVGLRELATAWTAGWRKPGSAAYMVSSASSARTR